MEDMSGLFGGSIGGPGFKIGPAFKLCLVAGLILVLLVPLLLVSQLIAEREQRADSVRHEVAGLWGEQQLINGPVLVVPYSYLPLDFYKVISRAAKYAVMFLASAFMAVFLIELRSPRLVHPVQYFFVGFAMAFFYVLLLSFSEYLGFAKAYLVAACATGGMLSAYVARVQASVVKGAIMLMVFLVLYAFLYLVLRLEDYALLAGAVLGFILMTGVMFSTLKVDWSGGGAANAQPAPAD